MIPVVNGYQAVADRIPFCHPAVLIHDAVAIIQTLQDSFDVQRLLDELMILDFDFSCHKTKVQFSREFSVPAIIRD